MNKTTAVLQWLQSNASISSMEAIKQFGATRLSAHIFNLRKRGYNIETVMVDGRDRFGNPMRFARYYLRDSPSQDGGNEL
jgi:hypothetical protein